jgi:hypothetical protein
MRISVVYESDRCYALSQRDDIFVTADFNRRDKKRGRQLSRRDNILCIKVLSLRDKATNPVNCPPIEIGGYKYVVPLGRRVTSVSN